MIDTPTPTLPETIDELMALDPLELSKSPETYEKYIAGVIAYHRNSRAMREAGVKPSRGKAGASPGEGAKKLADLIAAKKPVAVKSAVGSGIRRL